jgi:hypothetical protein
VCDAPVRNKCFASCSCTSTPNVRAVSWGGRRAHFPGDLRETLPKQSSIGHIARVTQPYSGRRAPRDVVGASRLTLVARCAGAQTQRRPRPLLRSCGRQIMSLTVTRSKERMELAALPRLTFKSRVVRLNTDLQAVEFGECHRNRSLRSRPPRLGRRCCPGLRMAAQFFWGRMTR